MSTFGMIACYLKSIITSHYRVEWPSRSQHAGDIYDIIKYKSVIDIYVSGHESSQISSSRGRAKTLSTFNDDLFIFFIVVHKWNKEIMS